MSRLKPEILQKTALEHDGRKVSIEIWRVTPTFARQELKNANVGNRKMKPLHVAQLKHDIQAGNWITLTSECVGYDENGHLINGQNRFQAIADSGQSVHVVVWRNLASEVKYVLDQGVVRTGADVLGFAGEEKYLSVHATALRAVAAWDAGYLIHSGMKSSRYTPFSKSDMLETNQKHPGLAESVRWAAANARKERCQVVPTAMLAFLHYETSLVDTVAAQEFWEGYSNNDFPNSSGDPRWAMWKRLKQVHDTKAHNKVTGIYVFVGFRAWNLWRDGQEVSSLLYVVNKSEKGPRGRQRRIEEFKTVQEPH